MHVQEPVAKSMWGIISPIGFLLKWHNENKCVRSFNMELFHVVILSNSNKFYNQCIAFLL